MDIMIDLETLGTRPGCMILSIGATTFDCLNQFHVRTAPEDPRFFCDTSTLDWWDRQDPSTKQAAFAGEGTMEEMLFSFAGFYNRFPGARIWGNAASFDLKILEKAYQICDLPVPWGYREEMCYRTLKNLYPQIKAPNNPNKHDALSDAITQAIHAQEILGFIKANPNY